MRLIEMKYINLIHVFVTGILLMYLGIKKNQSNKYAFYLLALLAIEIPFLNYFPKNLNLNYWNVIHIFHYFIILPWFLYLAYDQNISDNYGQVLFFIGLTVSSYHSYKALNRFGYF